MIVWYTFNTQNCFPTAVISSSNFKSNHKRVRENPRKFTFNKWNSAGLHVSRAHVKPGVWGRLWGAVEMCSEKIITLLEHELSDRSDITRTYVCSLPWHSVTAIARRQGRPSGITSFTIFLRPSTTSVCYFYAFSTVKFRSIDLPRC